MGVLETVKNIGSDHAPVVPLTLFVAVLCLCLVIGHLLEENRWVNESITAIIIGGVTGTIILVCSKGKDSHILTFNEEVFFIYLLPPIIFNAGFQVKKKQFFHNFLTIMLFGVIGVFISALIITSGSQWLFPRMGFHGLSARDYIAIGAIFSSTDTVCTLQVLHQEETPLLYSLVFGEGVVNDATSVVLFNAVQKIDITRLNSKTALHVFGDFCYLFSTSTVLGVTAGLLTAYILKTLYFGRHSSVRELAIMVLMAYLSYMLAELLELSGILTVFFCGVIMSHYAWHNVTDSSKITTRHVFSMMSFVAETAIFLYVGMDALDIEKWKITKLSLWKLVGTYTITVFLILLGRAAFVFPLSAISNYFNKREDRSSSSSIITFKQQIIIWWAGLMRGAVSIALAFKQFTYSGVTRDPTHATMITITTVVVLFTTVVFGFLTKPLIRCLLPLNQATNSASNSGPKFTEEDITLPLLSMEESAATNVLRAKDSLSMLMERPVYTIHFFWRKFDDYYMRPIFGGPCHSNQPSGSGC
ncbi:sodium/hydrogen exchanger 4 [Cucurbita pepo subsp. pepo]|uniref:sodium/hydrogen exchanger 4 n=1 Tax=Cucurbita pepo subsp. pepo TaxID=3664 RepID=UPI000C9D6BC0|nr:sodium/hydrogen exchanger 4 [Cucurbita pepo subsp. pepo]